MRKIAISMLAAAGVLALSASPATAADTPNCNAGASVSSLSVTGGTVVAACGFFDGKNYANKAEYVDAAFSYFGLGSAPASADWGVTDGGKSWTGEQYVNALSQDFLGTAGPLFGDIVVAFHTGNGNKDWGNATAFFLIQAGEGGVTSILPNPGTALSGATLYLAGTPHAPDGVGPLEAAVPEPASWAMMLAGFGLVGFGLRGRRRTLATVTA